MKNILIVSGHTDLAHSVANKTILETLEKRVPAAEILKLDERYPDFKIDVPAEQARLQKAEIVVLQFPLFWYSAPSILERWMEETFKHGFSHGSTGDKLKGKKLVISLTTGAPLDYYQGELSFDNLMTCFKCACQLTQMEFAGIVATGGVSYGNRTSPELIEKQKIDSVAHAERLIDLLATL